MKKQFILQHIYQKIYYNGVSPWGGANGICRNVDVEEEFIFNSLSKANSFLDSVPHLLSQYKAIEYTPKLKPKRGYETHHHSIPTFKKGRTNEFCLECGTNILADETYLEWNAKPICLHCAMRNLEGISSYYKNTNDTLKAEWEEVGSENFKNFTRKMKI